MSVAGSIIFAVSISYFYEIQYKRCYLWGYFGQMWERYRRCLKNTAHWQVGVAFFTILLLCMLTEFIIALTAFMYWYKAGCNGCCKVAAPGVSFVHSLHLKLAASLKTVKARSHIFECGTLFLQIWSVPYSVLHFHFFLHP